MIAELVLASFPLILPTDLNSQPLSALDPLRIEQNYTPPSFVLEYPGERIYPRNVTSILQGTEFKPICFSNFKEKTSLGMSVVFFYVRGHGIGKRKEYFINFETSKAMAEVLRRSLNRIQDGHNINFYMFDADCSSTAQDTYSALRESPFYIPNLPYLVTIKNGKRVTETYQSMPTFDESLLEEWVGDMLEHYDILRKF